MGPAEHALKHSARLGGEGVITVLAADLAAGARRVSRRQEPRQEKLAVKSDLAQLANQSAEAVRRNRQEDVVPDAHAERAGDLAQPLIAGRGVAFGLVALNLLLLQAQPLGQGLLAEPAGNPRLDEAVSELVEGVDGDHGQVGGLQPVILGKLGPEVGQLAFHRLALSLQ